ncbi:MAG TPA: hypothetical protein DEP84_14950 [Chloroflexi bacterium]|nr:hypothetical protein [Chloroflexota bacterium]
MAFIGFPQVTQTDPVGTVTETQYYATADPTAPENGLPHHTEVQVGAIIRATQDNLDDLTTPTTWGTKPVPLLETRRSTTDENNTTRSFRTTYQYDSYGNLSQTTEYGEVQSDYTTDIPGDERTTASIYRSRITPTVYIVDHPVERSIYEGLQAIENQLAARTQFYYDGSATRLAIAGNCSKSGSGRAACGPSPSTSMMRSATRRA